MGIDPDVILGWRGSKVAMWMVVADRQRRTDLLREMVALTYAVWDPKELSKLLGDREPVTRETADEALARAERVINTRMGEVTLEELQTRRKAAKLKKDDEE